MTDKIEVEMRCLTVLPEVVVQHQLEKDEIIRTGKMKIKTQDWIFHYKCNLLINKIKERGRRLHLDKQPLIKTLLMGIMLIHQKRIN